MHTCLTPLQHETYTHTHSTHFACWELICDYMIWRFNLSMIAGVRCIRKHTQIQGHLLARSHPAAQAISISRGGQQNKVFNDFYKEVSTLRGGLDLSLSPSLSLTIHDGLPLINSVCFPMHHDSSVLPEDV